MDWLVQSKAAQVVLGAIVLSQLCKCFTVHAFLFWTRNILREFIRRKFIEQCGDVFWFSPIHWDVIVVYVQPLMMWYCCCIRPLTEIWSSYLSLRKKWCLYTKLYKILQFTCEDVEVHLLYVEYYAEISFCFFLGSVGIFQFIHLYVIFMALPSVPWITDARVLKSWEEWHHNDTWLLFQCCIPSFERVKVMRY